MAVAAGIAAVQVFDGKGVEIVVGPIQSGLPSLGLPDVRWTDYAVLASSAIGILLVGFGEGLAAVGPTETSTNLRSRRTRWSRAVAWSV